MQIAGNLSTSVLKKAIDRYYKELQDCKGRADYELAARTAFLNLLAETVRQVKWLLVPEQALEGGIRPDGVLRYNFDLKRGSWEAKGPQSDLDKEIARLGLAIRLLIPSLRIQIRLFSIKIKSGYMSSIRLIPKRLVIFSISSLLIQSKNRILR